MHLCRTCTTPHTKCTIRTTRTKYAALLPVRAHLPELRTLRPRPCSGETFTSVATAKQYCDTEDDREWEMPTVDEQVGCAWVGLCQGRILVPRVGFN